MRSLSKDKLIDMLCFVDKQRQFIIDTTQKVNTHHDFLLSQTTMVLFNSTCMCLQTIGETMKIIDNLTAGTLLTSYTDIPWRSVIGLRNILSHEYSSIDPEEIFRIVKFGIPPLLSSIRQIITNTEVGLHDKIFHI